MAHDWEHGLPLFCALKGCDYDPKGFPTIGQHAAGRIARMAVEACAGGTGERGRAAELANAAAHVLCTDGKLRSNQKVKMERRAAAAQKILTSLCWFLFQETVDADVTDISRPANAPADFCAGLPPPSSAAHNYCSGKILARQLRSRLSPLATLRIPGHCAVPALSADVGDLAADIPGMVLDEDDQSWTTAGMKEYIQSFKGSTLSEEGCTMSADRLRAVCKLYQQLAQQGTSTHQRQDPGGLSMAHHLRKCYHVDTASTADLAADSRTAVPADCEFCFTNLSQVAREMLPLASGELERLLSSASEEDGLYELSESSVSKAERRFNSLEASLDIYDCKCTKTGGGGAAWFGWRCPASQSKFKSYSCFVQVTAGGKVGHTLCECVGSARAACHHIATTLHVVSTLRVRLVAVCERGEKSATAQGIPSWRNGAVMDSLGNVDLAKPVERHLGGQAVVADFDPRCSANKRAARDDSVLCEKRATFHKAMRIEAWTARVRLNRGACGEPAVLGACPVAERHAKGLLCPIAADYWAESKQFYLTEEGWAADSTDQADLH